MFMQLLVKNHAKMLPQFYATFNERVYITSSHALTLPGRHPTEAERKTGKNNVIPELSLHRHVWKPRRQPKAKSTFDYCAQAYIALFFFLSCASVLLFFSLSLFFLPLLFFVHRMWGGWHMLETMVLLPSLPPVLYRRTLLM